MNGPYIDKVVRGGHEHSYDCAMASTAEAPKKRPALEAALDELHLELDRATDMLSKLEDRLRPIMLPEGPIANGNDKAEPMSSPAVGVIRSAIHRVSLLRRRMTEYLERLET